MYFDNFPTIPYDAEGNGKFKDVKNLLRRVGIRAKVKANTMLFDTYDVKNGETPESIAFKLYNDSIESYNVNLPIVGVIKIISFIIIIYVKI